MISDNIQFNVMGSASLICSLTGAASSEEDNGIREEGLSVRLGTAEAGLNQDAQVSVCQTACSLQDATDSYRLSAWASN